MGSIWLDLISKLIRRLHMLYRICNSNLWHHCSAQERALVDGWNGWQLRIGNVGHVSLYGDPWPLLFLPMQHFVTIYPLFSCKKRFQHNQCSLNH